MLLRGRGPWVVSTGLHVALLAWGAVLLLQSTPPVPTVLRMRLTAPVGGPVASVPSATWMPPESPSQVRPGEPSIPSWQATTAPATARPAGTVPVSLDELLVVPPVSESPVPSIAEAGWSGPPGLGYAPPPLPPPTLVPPQGAQWSLVLTVPPGGGPAEAIEGLNSGHPELDLWLEAYLRTVSLPSAPDGARYELRWALRLASGRPE